MSDQSVHPFIPCHRTMKGITNTFTEELYYGSLLLFLFAYNQDLFYSVKSISKLVRSINKMVSHQLIAS